ncbi:MAG: CDP-glycerol glycerophosphotransferase family protein [Acutalibacteraceae bacterium]|jgi:CDP-ribitol ribitolphosphotransferase
MKIRRDAIGKFWRLKIKYPLYYRLCALRPADPKRAVFIENRLSTLTSSFSLLHEELTARYDCRVSVCYLLKVDGTRRQYDRRCMKMIRQVARAGVVFVNDSSNVVGCLPFRKSTRVVQLWHACGAFKKWGFSNGKGKFGASLRELKRYPYYADYDLVTVSSPEVIWAYSEAFNIPMPNDVVQATGVSRTDVFFREDFRQKAFARLYETVPQARGKKVILYAPTFRGSVGKAMAPSNLNQEAFCERFADRYVLLCKHHPSVRRRPPIRPGCENTVFDVTDSLSIEELMCVADALITDYSSVVFEYSLFGRPILIYAYDIAQYTDWRGFYYDFESFVPGPILRSNRQLLESIARLEQYDLSRVRQFRDTYMSACDGGATKRIIDAAFAGKLQEKKAL